MQYCSLNNWTLLSPPDTSTTVRHFCFGPVTAFFLELLVTALSFSPVAYWTPTNLRGSSFSVISFCLFILSMGFSRQEYWSGLPPLVDHVLSELFTMTRSSSVALHSMAHSFIELCNPLCHDEAVIHEEEYLCYWLALFSVFLILKIRKIIFPGEQIRKYMCIEDLPWWLRR